MSNNAHELSNRLLNALDTNYNVVDMVAVNDIISILEKSNITKELLETTRLGRHVNELRRKTNDQSLARRAKILVKRWRDMVIPLAASPAHTGSNRSSAERQVRIGRLGGTPLTSPALPTHALSSVVSSPKTNSNTAWAGYESDSQDVILVDDDPPPIVVDAEATLPSPLTTSLNTSVKPLSPVTIVDERKVKRDKKPKKRKGHSRAGSESLEGPWSARNGAPRKNGCARTPVDAYAALVNRIPPAGGKKVKTTKELLREIQSRGTKPAPLSPHSPGSPHSPDVMLIEPEPSPPSSAQIPQNGSSSPLPPFLTPLVPPLPFPALEDEREYAECTCGDEEDPHCMAAGSLVLKPVHVHSLHHAYLPGVNGTRAPIFPHQFAVRKLTDPDAPELFASVVPLYKYSDYADDHCSKNMSKVPLCTHLPWTEWAPPPPSPPRPKTPPTPRPYPIVIETKPEVQEECDSDSSATNIDEDSNMDVDSIKEFKEIKAEEIVEEDKLEPNLELERLQPDADETEDCMQTDELQTNPELEEPNSVNVPLDIPTDIVEHRTVERTKELDGRTIYEFCKSVRDSIPYNYSQVCTTPIVNLNSNEAVLEEAFSAECITERDGLGRPLRPDNFSEWHECARLGELIALPYVVID